MTELLEIAGGIDVNRRVNPVTQDTSDIKDVGLRRILTIALPFLCFYRPTQVIAALGLGGYQLYTISSGIVENRHTRTKEEQLKAAGKLTLVTAFMALEVTLPEVGTVLAFGYLSLVRAKKSAEHFENKKYAKAARNALHSTSMLVYIASVLTGRPALIAASLLSEGLLESWQAERQRKKGHYPEMVAATALALISFIGGYRALSYV